MNFERTTLSMLAHTLHYVAVPGGTLPTMSLVLRFIDRRCIFPSTSGIQMPYSQQLLCFLVDAATVLTSHLDLHTPESVIQDHSSEAWPIVRPSSTTSQHSASNIKQARNLHHVRLRTETIGPHLRLRWLWNHTSPLQPCRNRSRSRTNS